MSDPLSIAQMLSSRSMRTLCANDQPYSCRPTSRMNSPLGPNSSNCAAAAPYAGPDALFDRVKTKMCPFELTATPGTSPKFIPSGSFRKSGTESNGISGAEVICAGRDCASGSPDSDTRTTAACVSRFIWPPGFGTTKATKPTKSLCDLRELCGSSSFLVVRQREAQNQVAAPAPALAAARRDRDELLAVDGVDRR